MGERPEACGGTPLIEVQIIAGQVRVNISLGEDGAGKLVVTGTGENGDPTLAELSLGTAIGQKILTALLNAGPNDILATKFGGCAPPRDLRDDLACEFGEKGKTSG